MKAVILAAGKGTRLEPLTLDIPKCMAPVAGIPLVDRLIARIGEAGIDDVIVVTGCHAEVLERHLAGSDDPLARAATCVFNEHFSDWGNFYSLLVAREAIGTGSFVKLDGDVVIDGRVLPAVLAADGPGVIAIDRSNPLGEEEMKTRVVDGRVVALNKRMNPSDAFGESIGIERIDAPLAPTVWDYLQNMIGLGETDEYYERGYELAMQGGTAFGYADISAYSWTEIDTPEDLAYANDLAAADKV